VNGWMIKFFDVLTDKLINDRPNTYTYTKALAEYVISQEVKYLPLAIIRPSIVGSSWREPIPGWIDNYNGPSGLLVAMGKGMLHIVLGNINAVADIVPVDVCVNMMITVAWHTAIKRPKKIPVYHCCTGHLGTLTWGKVAELSNHHLDTICMEKAIIYPSVQVTENRFRYFYIRTLQELLPAYIIDIYRRLIGRKPICTKLSYKIYKSVRTLQFFTSNTWIFSNDNSILLQDEMNDTDQQLFSFDMKDLDWSHYWRNYCIGLKQYLLQEDISRMSKCYVRNQRLKRIQNALLFSIVPVVIRIFFVKSFKLRQIFITMLRWLTTMSSMIIATIGLL